MRSERGPHLASCVGQLRGGCGLLSSGIGQVRGVAELLGSDVGQVRGVGEWLIEIVEQLRSKFEQLDSVAGLFDDAAARCEIHPLRGALIMREKHSPHGCFRYWDDPYRAP